MKMQALLADIQLDVHELKCVMDALSRDSSKTLREVAKRNVLQMRTRLDLLLEELEVEAESPDIMESPGLSPKKEVKAELPKAEIPKPEVPKTEIEEAPLLSGVSILAESIRPGVDLCRSISLNDSFRFSRELFAGDAARMNRVLQQVGEMQSLEAAIASLLIETKTDEENPAMADLLELLRKHFK